MFYIYHEIHTAKIVTSYGIIIVQIAHTHTHIHFGRILYRVESQASRGQGYYKDFLSALFSYSMFHQAILLGGILSPKTP